MPLFDLNYKKANGEQFKKVCACIVLICSTFQLFGQSAKTQWIDSVFHSLSFEEKIGQLIMIRVNAYADADEKERIEDQITSYGIGGIVFTQGGPVTQTQLTRQLQSIASIPLLVGLNAEEGLGSTLDSTLVFPQTLMLGAINNDSLLFQLGREVGRQMNELGVHITFAPTADVSTIFHTTDLISRTFGDNPERVARATVSYMKGLQSAGIIPVAKHYPSYGLKVQGYSKGAPVMALAQDDKTVLIPLQKLIDNGCPAILSSYKQEPIFPDRRKRITAKKKIVPTALPALYTADFIKRNLNFQGLIFSHVPDVNIVLKKYQPGDSEIYTFLAGNDILLFPENIGATVRKLRRQIRKNQVLKDQLDQRVKKILSFKYDAGLHQPRLEPPTEKLLERITTLEANLFKQTLFEKAVTIVKDEKSLLPVKTLETESFASLSIGEQQGNEFTAHLSKYVRIDNYAFTHRDNDTTQLIRQLGKYSIIVVGIFANSVELEETYPALLKLLAEHSNLIICNFTPASKLSLLENPSTVVQAFVDNPSMRKIVSEILFGGLPASGVFPLTINEFAREGDGIPSANLKRLTYGIPEEVGVDSRMLERIDLIAKEAIETQATPGCHVLVARRGKIIYDKSFGWHTYDKQVPITDQSIFDLASVTKVLATLQSVMFLYDRGMIDVNKKVSVYLNELQSTNKKDITLRDVLTHQAGLVPFIPLWPSTMKNEKEFLPLYYSRKRSEKYSLQVAPDLFAAPIIRDSLWKWTFDSKMLEKPARTPYTLRYSDIGFWIMHRLAEKLLNQPLDEFLWQNFYEPLGAFSTGYLPLNRFNKSQLVPTEFDKIFRKSMIVGTVHDERAAMMGGVAGHAGLFSNALDIAKLGQMLLQKGYYGGYQYLKPETVDFFTHKQFETSRRGLGWDKPIQSDWASPTSLFASTRTFGHTGFTGTCIWIDPEFDLVYVFLSNRVYPDRSNKLISSNIRSRIQDVIYQSIFKYCQ